VPSAPRSAAHLLSVNVASSEHGSDVSERRTQGLPVALGVRGRSPASGGTWRRRIARRAVNRSTSSWPGSMQQSGA